VNIAACLLLSRRGRRALALFIYRQWISGQKEGSLAVLKKIAAVLNVTLDDLA